MCDNSIKCTLKFRGLSLYVSFLFRSDEGLLQLYDILNLLLYIFVCYFYFDGSRH